MAIINFSLQGLVVVVVPKTRKNTPNCHRSFFVCDRGKIERMQKVNVWSSYGLPKQKLHYHFNNKTFDLKLIVFVKSPKQPKQNLVLLSTQHNF